MKALLKLVLAALAVLQLPGGAVAQPAAPEWRPLGNSNGMDISWDAAGVERGGTIIVPVRFARPAGGNGDNAYAITRVELNCAAAEAHAILTVNYSADGIAGTTDRVPMPYVAITPGSLFAELQRQVC